MISKKNVKAYVKLEFSNNFFVENVKILPQISHFFGLKLKYKN